MLCESSPTTEILRCEAEREALPGALAACRILPAGIGENVGDYAALAVADMD